MENTIENYGNRFVAFIDILGFKSIVENTENDTSEYIRIKNVLNYIAGVRTDNYQGPLAKYGILKEISVFSDSIVISYSQDISIGGSLFHILLDLIFLCLDLLNANIFVRGAVTHGKMYHDEKVCFGPAMIDAYQKEEKIAVYPRIIIDAKAIEMGIKYHGQSNTPEWECEYLANIISQDKDGQFFLDYLSQIQEFDSTEAYINYMRRIKNYITMNLSKEYDSKIQEKYLWFAEYYNKALTRVFDDPSDLLI